MNNNLFKDMIKGLLTLLFILTFASCVKDLPPPTQSTQVLLTFTDWQCTFGINVKDCGNQVVTRLDKIFAQFDIGFTTRDAYRTSYQIFFDNNGPEQWNIQGDAAGAAPTQCDSRSGAGVVFRCGTDGSYCARIAAHELGHLMGLDHVNEPKDIMSWVYKGSEAFMDASYPTINGACRGEQNSRQELTRRFGSWRNGRF